MKIARIPIYMLPAAGLGEQLVAKLVHETAETRGRDAAAIALPFVSGALLLMLFFQPSEPHHMALAIAAFCALAMAGMPFVNRWMEAVRLCDAAESPAVLASLSLHAGSVLGWRTEFSLRDDVTRTWALEGLEQSGVPFRLTNGGAPHLDDERAASALCALALPDTLSPALLEGYRRMLTATATALRSGAATDVVRSVAVSALVRPMERSLLAAALTQASDDQIALDLERASELVTDENARVEAATLAAKLRRSARFEPGEWMKAATLLARVSAWLAVRPAAASVPPQSRTQRAGTVSAALGSDMTLISSDRTPS